MNDQGLNSEIELPHTARQSVTKILLRQRTGCAGHELDTIYRSENDQKIVGLVDNSKQNSSPFEYHVTQTTTSQLQTGVGLIPVR